MNVEKWEEYNIVCEKLRSIPINNLSNHGIDEILKLTITYDPKSEHYIHEDGHYVVVIYDNSIIKIKNKFF